jgi:hypothetical protein
LLNRVAASVSLVFAGLICGYVAGQWSLKQDILEPLQEVTVTDVGLRFRARLDTGAVVSSINAHEIKVLGGGERPSRDDAGKMVSFVLINAAGESRPLVAKIEQVRGIRTADCREVRYHVNLTVSHRGRRYNVLTNLNDRSRAGDKFLLGRNWLHYGFAVAPVKDAEI